MSDRYYNPFQNAELRVPEQWRAEVSTYCQGPTQDGRKAGLAEAPFPRIVDMWFLALCLGVRDGKRKELPMAETHKFNDGGVLASDPWRIDFLMLLAIGVTGEEKIVGDPGGMIRIANEYAAAGMSSVVQMLKDGDAEAIYNLSDSLEDAIRKGQAENA